MANQLPVNVFTVTGAGLNDDVKATDLRNDGKENEVLLQAVDPYITVLDVSKLAQGCQVISASCEGQSAACIDKRTSSSLFIIISSQT